MENGCRITCCYKIPVFEATIITGNKHSGYSWVRSSGKQKSFLNCKSVCNLICGAISYCFQFRCFYWGRAESIRSGCVRWISLNRYMYGTERNAEPKHWQPNWINYVAVLRIQRSTFFVPIQLKNVRKMLMLSSLPRTAIHHFYSDQWSKKMCTSTVINAKRF